MSAQRTAQTVTYDIVMVLLSGGMMIVEKIGLDVPEPWRSQGFVRIWIIRTEAHLVCFSRTQAEELLRITTVDSNGVALDAIQCSSAQLPHYL